MIVTPYFEAVFLVARFHEYIQFRFYITCGVKYVMLNEKRVLVYPLANSVKTFETLPG